MYKEHHLVEERKTLKEMCNDYICDNIQDFKQDSVLSLLPDNIFQEIIDILGKMQYISLELLSNYRKSNIVKLNLSYCGRVNNEWSKILKDLPLQQLNLSHCLINNDAILSLKKKKKKEDKKEDKKEEKKEKDTKLKGKMKQSPTKKKKKKKEEKEEKKDVKLSPIPSPNIFPIQSSLQNLNLSYIGEIGNLSLSVLSNSFQSIKMLSLEGCHKLNNESLEIISRMKQLTALNLRGCQKITNKGIVEIQKLSNLEVLNLSDIPKITHESLNIVFEKLDQLIYLNLSSNDKIISLEELKELKNLRTIDLGCIPNINLDCIEKNKQIQCLILNYTNIKELKSIYELENIKKLNLSNCILLENDEINRCLKYLVNLTDLNLMNTKIDTNSMSYISEMKELKILNIRGCNNLTNSSFEFFEKMKQLKDLNISLMKDITKGWIHLSKKNYNILDLGGCIHENNIEYFYDILLNDSLEALYLTNDYLDSKLCKNLCRLKKLKCLDLSHSNLSDKDSILLKNLVHIQTLSLRNCNNLSEKGLLFIKNFEYLEYLDISNTNISDLFLNEISNLKNLTYLSLMNCKNLSDSGMKYLKPFEKLISLNLYKIPISDKGILFLKDLKNISTLRLSLWEMVSEKSFDSLHDLPNLVYLKTNSFNDWSNN